MAVSLYIRVSRPDEIDILENQRRSGLEYAARLNYPPDQVRIYDETASGGDAERAGLGSMLRSIRPGDLVIFTGLSRMTRGGIGAALDILRQIERAGAGWHFIEQPSLNWDAGTPQLARDILLSVLAAIDQDYRRRISEKTREAFRRKKSAGWHGKGRTPGAKDVRPRKRPAIRGSPRNPLVPEAETVRGV
jgi:DNA invertase Pin-like site-specific DNA recombinase